MVPLSSSLMTVSNLSSTCKHHEERNSKPQLSISMYHVHIHPTTQSSPLYHTYSRLHVCGLRWICLSLPSPFSAVIFVVYGVVCMYKCYLLGIVCCWLFGGSVCCVRVLLVPSQNKCHFFHFIDYYRSPSYSFFL